MNFYSYSLYEGMQYHATATEAKQAAEEAQRKLVVSTPSYSAADLATTTWGEVTERIQMAGEHVGCLKRQDRLSYETEHPQVVDGRMEDAEGSLVLVRNIHEKDLLFNDLVLSIACIWMNLSGKIQRFKQHNFEDVATILDLIFEKYGVKRGGREGNMQFFTFDRRYKLRITVQKQIDFGPELQAAQSKLLEAVEQMAPSDTDNAADLKTIVLGTFSLLDGKLRVSEILRLRSYKISNALWNEGIQIINEAIVIISRKKQILLYERDAQGEYIAIPLDIAAL
jgi:hypothetical protein